MPGNVGWYGLAKQIQYCRRDIEAAPNTSVAWSVAMALDIANAMAACVAPRPANWRRTNQAQIFMHHGQR